jgi:hypothetical protein
MSKEEEEKIFKDIPIKDKDEIIKITFLVNTMYYTEISKAINKSGQSSSFKGYFREIYIGSHDMETASSKAWRYYRQTNQILSIVFYCKYLSFTSISL